MNDEEELHTLLAFLCRDLKELVPEIEEVIKKINKILASAKEPKNGSKTTDSM